MIKMQMKTSKHFNNKGNEVMPGVRSTSARLIVLSPEQPSLLHVLLSLMLIAPYLCELNQQS